jgi:hypothetical protein
MRILYLPDTICDFGELVPTCLKTRRELRLSLRLLLENKCRKECSDFFRRIGSKCILENQLRENKFIRRVNLPYATST